MSLPSEKVSVDVVNDLRVFHAERNSVLLVVVAIAKADGGQGFALKRQIVIVIMQCSKIIE